MRPQKSILVKTRSKLLYLLLVQYHKKEEESMKKKLTTLKGSISRLIASFICVLLVIGLFPSTVFAAACSAEIEFKVIPVYLDASMYLGYDIDYDNAWIGTLPCTYNTDHASNANHQIQVKGFHPDVIKLQVREGYEWAGWAKYTINLQDVKNPPFPTYYDWSSEDRKSVV